MVTPSRSLADAPLPRRLRWLLALFALVVVAAGVFWIRRPPLIPITRPPRPEALDPQVRDHLQQLIRLVESQPRDPAHRATLALAYAANGLWEEARRAFLDAATLAPDEPLAHLYAAVALQEKSDDAGALREFQALSARFPEFAPGWYRVGEAAMRLGDTTNAEMAFTRLTRLAPGEWRGPAGMAEVHLRRGQASNALPFLEHALRIDRFARPAQFLFGQALRAVGRTNEARVALALGSGQSRQPMPDAWSELAPLHMKSLPDQLAQADELATRGRPDLAVKLLMGALRFHPDHPGLANQLAVAFNRMGNPGQAVPLLNPLIARDPKAVAARITRSHALVQMGRADAGLEDARVAVSLSPGTAQAHLAVANALLALERDAEAVAALRQALQTDPRNADIHVELGDVLWRNQGDLAGAAAMFAQAVNLNPALAKAYNHLGQLQKHSGDVSAARATLAALQQVAPGGPDYRELRDAMNAP